MALEVKAGDSIRVNVPVRNVGTVVGNFKLNGRIVDGNNVQQGNFMVIGSATNAFLSSPINPAETKTLVMEKTNWANGDPYGFDHLMTFKVEWTVEVIETGQKISVTDPGVITHFRGIPMAQFVTPRTYSIL